MAKDGIWKDVPEDIPRGPGGTNITDGEDSGEYLQRMSDGTPRNFWRNLEEFLAGAESYLRARGLVLRCIIRHPVHVDDEPGVSEEHAEIQHLLAQARELQGARKDDG